MDKIEDKIAAYNARKANIKMAFFPDADINEINYCNLPEESWPRYIVRYQDYEELDMAMIVAPKYAHVSYVNNVTPPKE